MPFLDNLISKYCPDGVEYKTLGELGAFYGGLTGKSKKDFQDGNAVFISYKNVYSNPALDIHPSDRVRISAGEKQRTLQLGDIIFTGSSETPDECGFSSVVTEEPIEPLYLNSFCFFLRMHNPEILLPDFAKHLFRSNELRYQIGKTASGVTRFNVSKEKMQDVEVPVPPMKVQREIVRVLDKFTLLRQELSAELSARRKQYEYYRDELLTFGDDVPKMALGNICYVQTGGTPSKKNSEYWSNGTIKWLGSSVCQNKKRVDEVTDYITEEGMLRSAAKYRRPGTTLIAMVGSTIGKVAFLDFEATTNQNVASLYPQKIGVLDESYLYYACTILYDKFQALLNNGFAMANLNFIRNLEIPVPDIKTQKAIVDILDKFEKICEDINSGLPAEIEARTKQYEYYRDKLLSFKRKEAS